MNALRPLQNRVDPFGVLCAVVDRGRLMGNRGGRFHRDDQSLKKRPWATKQWIACVCEFKGRHREVFGHGYTELFFRDEPTALAAGHRPCFECRRKDAKAFQARFPGGPMRAPEMDLRLHAERLDPERLKQTRVLDGLPDGAMVLWRERPHLVAGDRLWRWSFSAYEAPASRPGAVDVICLTPPSIVATLIAGYRPRLDEAALELRA